MVSRKVRAWELIEEDDGTTTLEVEYEDGARDAFMNVKLNAIEESLPSVGMKSVPVEFKVVKS